METRLDGSLSDMEKHELLLKILNEKLEAGDKAAAPKTLEEVDHKAWDDVMLAVVTMQGQLNRLSDQEATLRLMIDKKADPTNLSHFHNLAEALLRQGKYAEAEDMETKARDWLDGKLGKDSPQSLGARKIIAEAVWKQGRVEEARGLLGEMEQIIEEGGEGTYGIYMEEQRETLGRAREELEEWKDDE
jgi:predicted Zn-dependent protease